MKGGFDRSKSLQDLEKDNWGEPTYDTYLVKTCHHLRRKPLNQFTVEDLRIMIGQQISLPILIPLAVEKLELEPLVEACFYPGDLLGAVLNANEAFWVSHADSLQGIRYVVTRVRDTLSSLDEITGPRVQTLLKDAPALFTADASR